MNQIRGFFGTAQAIVLLVVVAILSWKYFLHDIFFPEVPDLRVEVSHQIYSACLNQNTRWVRTKVTVTNAGSGPVELAPGEHHVAQIAPSDQFSETPKAQTKAFNWPTIVSVSDSDATTLKLASSFDRDLAFLIDPSVRVIEISSTYKIAPSSEGNNTDPWIAETIYDVGDSGCSN